MLSYIHILYRIIILCAYLRRGRDGDVAQLVEDQTGTSLTQVRFPGGARDFSPSQLSVQTLLWCPYTPMCSHMYLHLCACWRSCSPCQSSVDYGNTKIPSMHLRLGSATLSQLAFPGEGNLNFPWEKSHWDNAGVKKKKKRRIFFLKGFHLREGGRNQSIQRKNPQQVWKEVPHITLSETELCLLSQKWNFHYPALLINLPGNMGLYVHRNHSGLLGMGKLGGQEFYI